ncbi:MAG: flagellar basal body rod protein FlgC [Syntrophomonadaceae bacterium]|jgi:flagellar basal-body rod protein FlgC
MFSILDVSASGLRAEKIRLNLIAENLANLETTRTSLGGPYRRKIASFSEILDQRKSSRYWRGSDSGGGGVQVASIIRDQSTPIMVYDPQHPDAGADGFVAKPNINIADEIVDMITATRAYEANVTVMNTTKNLALKTLNIGRE